MRLLLTKSSTSRLVLKDLVTICIEQVFYLLQSYNNIFKQETKLFHLLIIRELAIFRLRLEHEKL